jgi:hypothetical protein
MKNYLLKLFAGIFCLCLSHSLFAQTAIGTGNNEPTDEVNNSPADSSFGFYIKYADNKEPQKPITNNQPKSQVVSYVHTNVTVTENLQEENIHIQPNPVKDFAYIKVDATREYKFTIEVTSIAGKILQQKTGKTNKGNNIINLDLHTYAKGIYMVTVTDDKGKRKMIKIIKE